MTKEQAIEAMKDGKKITHRWFTPDEWMTSDSRGYIYVLEDGVRLSAREFWITRNQKSWDDGYSIWEETDKK